MRAASFALAVASLVLPLQTDAQAPAPIFSVQSDLVVLDVTVRDGRGAHVTNLQRDAFKVFDEGQRRPIQLLAHTDTPATVGLLIDSSDSMLPARELVIAAAAAFAEASHPQDEIFALAFNEHVRAALPPHEPFTSDVNTLRAALDRSIRARGRTALYDAVLAGLDYLSRGSRARRVLVVVSDGADNASRASREEVFRKAQAHNAMIYTLGLRDPVRPREGDPGLLRDLARVTGGASFQPDDLREVDTALKDIARDIRHTYTIGYVPTQADRDGSFHRLRVEVESPDGRPLRVRGRSGYLAGPVR
jgi:VWFA-related protein